MGDNILTKWTLPEGRKPLTDADMADLTRRLADTAIEQSELYQAAKRDAEEAEAYAAELEAKLAKAVAFIEDLSEHQWPLDAQAKRILAELTGGKDE